MTCYSSVFYGIAVIFSFLFSIQPSSTRAQNPNVKVNVNTEKIVQVVDEKFVGVTLDSCLIRDRWLNFDFRSEKLLNLAHALAPCRLRVGGTAADMLTFDPNQTGRNKPMTNFQNEIIMNDNRNFTMTGMDWDLLNKFSSSVGWDVIFDLNVLRRRGNHWDPSNANILLNYTASRGYKVAGFQLGNEPNAFHHVFDLNISASELAMDFNQLPQLLHSYPEFLSSLIIGPDVTQVSKAEARDYFRKFLATGGGKVVNKATFHHYYVNGRTASLQDFMDPSVLDRLRTEIEVALNITAIYSAQAPVWLGETGSAYAGGAAGLSDAYVAGFMWMDKLGIAARYGVKCVLRQSFYKGFYGLLDQETLDPCPDYWLTVLYKRLVGGRVFNVTATLTTNKLRVYAHCTNTDSIYRYKAGSVTLYAMSLNTHQMTISLTQFPGRKLHVFWLTPGTDYNLKSKKVQLNGNTLDLVRQELPRLDPVQVSSSHINIPPKTFGFIVIPDAGVRNCMKTR